MDTRNSPLNINTIGEFLREIALECNIDKEIFSLKQNKSNYSIRLSNLLVFNLYSRKKTCYISSKKNYDFNFSNYPNVVDMKNYLKILLNSYSDLESLRGFFKISFLEESKQLLQEHFSCCSRYIECSDAKQCIHTDPIFSYNCAYRLNLNKGLIFYGKNKTI